MIDFRDLFVAALAKVDNDQKWTNAPFGKIKIVSNTKVGTVGQHFVESLCAAYGITARFPTDEGGNQLTQSPWDIEINGVTFELKTATEDVSGNFQFNHIRYHRTYDALLCLGVSPSALYFDVWSKADVVTTKAGNLVSMEKGANASYKLTKSPKVLRPIELFERAMVDFCGNFPRSKVRRSKR